MAAACRRLFSSVNQSRLVTAMVILNLLLVFLNLAVQLVEQRINGSVQVVAGLFGMHVLAWHVHSHFRFLLQLFDGQNDANAGYLVEMTDHGIQLVFDVFAQGGGNFDVVTTNLQIHFFLLSLQGLA